MKCCKMHLLANTLCCYESHCSFKYALKVIQVQFQVQNQSAASSNALCKILAQSALAVVLMFIVAATDKNSARLLGRETES